MVWFYSFTIVANRIARVPYGGKASATRTELERGVERCSSATIVLLLNVLSSTAMNDMHMIEVHAHKRPIDH